MVSALRNSSFFLEISGWLKDEEEKQECLRDYLTAYTVISFYEGEEEAKELKKYIKEKYVLDSRPWNPSQKLTNKSFREVHQISS